MSGESLFLWTILFVAVAIVVLHFFGVPHLGRLLARRREEQSRPAPAPMSEDRKLWESIFRADGEDGKCPACGSRGFYAGPEGGAFAQNIHCMNVDCRTNFWIFPLGEEAKIMGRRGFDWYPDGPEKNAAALTMLKEEWAARIDSGKVYAKFNGDHPAKQAVKIGEGYGWGVVHYTPFGEPIGVEGPFADQAAAIEAAFGTAFKFPPEPHRDPDNLTAIEAVRRKNMATRPGTQSEHRPDAKVIQLGGTGLKALPPGAESDRD